MNGIRYKYGGYTVIIYTHYDKRKCDIPDCVENRTTTIITRDDSDFWELKLCEGCTNKYNLDTFDVEKQRVGIALLKMKELI